MEAVHEKDMGTDVIDVKLSSQVISYDVTDALIKKLDEKYADGKYEVTDTKSYKVVVAGIAEVRGLRLKVEAKRKELKSDALEYGRKVDGEAKRIFALLEPIEVRLKDLKQAEDDRKAEAKAELAKIEQARVDGIRKKISDILNMTTGLLSLDAEQLQALADEIASVEIDMGEYMEFTQEAVEVKNDVSSAVTDALANRVKLDEEEAARKAEDERLQKVREEQEAEAKRLADIQKKQDEEREAREAAHKAEMEKFAAERKKQEDIARAEQEKIAEERRQFEAEKAKLEADRKSEQERKEREEFERKAKEEATRKAKEEAEAARIKADEDARLKAEKEEADRVQREKEAEEEAQRAEALRPDKEKILLYLDALQAIPFPELTNATAAELMSSAFEDIGKFVSLYREEADGL